MSYFQYIGTQERIYLSIVQPGKGSLVATPGLVFDFEESEPPTDGQWVPYAPPAEEKAPVKAPAKKDAEEK